MRVTIVAVGRLRAGPEHEMIADYLQRFERTGRALSLGPARLVEVEDRKNLGMEAEAVLIERALPVGSLTVTLDERGQMLTSPEFAALLARWRDEGRQEAAFVIGGADGIAPALRARGDQSVSFGRMVWPHMLVRVMLAEQLYRAASILSGAPYHRA